MHGRPYPGASPLSGQTDTATICQLGLPLVRVGFPSIGDQEVPEEYREGLGGMGVAIIPDLVQPIREMIYILIDTCTRSRDQVGLETF